MLAHILTRAILADAMVRAAANTVAAHCFGIRHLRVVAARIARPDTTRRIVNTEQRGHAERLSIVPMMPGIGGGGFSATQSSSDTIGRIGGNVRGTK